MAKLPSITTITSANNNITTLNANFSALRSAFTNFVSRDGETPNTMTANLDMNSQEILNAAAVRTSLLYIAGKLVNSIGNLANWAGTWATSTAYETYDIVYEPTNNSLYRCILDHTSGTFATDLTAEKWEVFVGNGLVDLNDATFVDLAVTGNLDLSGVDNLTTVRTDLGLAIGTDVQAFAQALQDISDMTQNAGDLLYSDGTNWQDLALGTAGQVLTVNSGATAPEWANNVGATQSFVIAVSDETTDLTTGTAKVTFRMPYAFTLTDVRASVTTAPVGSTIEVDINEGGVSVLSTVLSIDASEKTSETAATAAVISDASLADDAEMTIDIDQVGSTTAGAGLKVTLIGTIS